MNGEGHGELSEFKSGCLIVLFPIVIIAILFNLAFLRYLYIEYGMAVFLITLVLFSGAFIFGYKWKG